MALEEFWVHELMTLDFEYSIDRVAGLEFEHILDCASLRVFRSFWYFIALEPVYASLTCEEEKHVMSVSHIELFGKVCLTSA